MDFSETNIRRILQKAMVPPTEVNLKINITGRGAARYYFTSLFLQNILEKTEEEIAHYLLRKGVEFELAKLSMAINAVENLPAPEEETEYAL